MKKIMIIGCSGSGKSTLAKKLAFTLDLPLIHLDVLHWRNNWQATSRQEFDDLLLNEIQKEKWIIDGNFNRTIPVRLEHCDTVIFLDYPRTTCLFGVIKRVFKWYGKTRPDMGGNCPERFDLSFFKFIWNFNKNNREKYLAMLTREKDKKIIILHNRRECSKFLQELSTSSLL